MIRTTCAYCGVGCGLVVGDDDAHSPVIRSRRPELRAILDEMRVAAD